MLMQGSAAGGCWLLDACCSIEPCPVVVLKGLMQHAADSGHGCAPVVLICETTQKTGAPSMRVRRELISGRTVTPASSDLASRP